MRSRLETVGTVVVIVAAAAVAVATVYQSFIRDATITAVSFDDAGVVSLLSDAEWQDLLGAGVLMGDSSAPVTVLMFADLECPFCRRFHSALVDAKTEFGEDLAYVFVHYPIANHRFARPAARAAECAARWNMFGDYVDVLFTKQDSLGLKSWSSYAVEAEIPDTVAFGQCASERGPLPRVDRGRALGESVGVTSTPTVFVNRWRLAAPPYTSLAKVIKDVLAEKGPYDPTKHDGR